MAVPLSLYNPHELEFLFKHRPLNLAANEFRLIRVRRKPTFSTEILVIELRHANLDEEKGMFVALSYAWGPETPTEPIYIVDRDDKFSAHIFRVRQSLFDFISAASRSRSAIGLCDTWIWIDQICINQNDDVEKGHQVDQMSKLYSTAYSTLVWLGESRSAPHKYYAEGMKERGLTNTVLTSDQLQKIRDCPPEYWRQWNPRPIFPTILSERVMIALSVCTWEFMFRLMYCSWWRRTWIVQEVALATVVTIFIAGELLDLQELNSIFAIMVCEAKTDAIPDGADIIELITRFYSFVFFWIDAHSRFANSGPYSRKPDPLSWSDVLGMSVDTKCTIPIDHVYGVMGLLDEKLRVDADYSLSPRQVLVNVIKRQISSLEETSVVEWDVIARVIAFWNDIFQVEAIKPPGVVVEGKLPKQKIEIIKENMSLYLQEIGVPVPAELDGPADQINASSE